MANINAEEFRSIQIPLPFKNGTPDLEEQKRIVSRIETLLKIDTKDMFAGTFHHIGNLILRKWAHILGYEKDFGILDREDAKDFIEDCIEDLKLADREKLFPKPAVIEKIFNLSINTLTQIDKIIEEYFDYLTEYTQDIKLLFEYYRRKKIKSNLMDYDDLLYNTFLLLKEEKICNYYSSLFKYILVDEYQDTNRLQFKILQKLSSVHRNILVVGDDSQSIYSFRGAEIKNILEFPQIFKDCKIFKLELNYRSTPQILDIANNVISKNKNQFQKVLQPTKKEGILPWICSCRDTKQEAQFVVQKIIEHIKENIPLKEIAVLFRSHYQSLELELELIKHNIPYVVRGGLRFFEQAHIKDILSYLKIIVNPRDELSFKRTLKLHKGIGRKLANKIWSEFQENNYNLNFLLQHNFHLPKNALWGLENFREIMKNLISLRKPQEMLEYILNQFYKDYIYLTFEDPQERIMDIEQLIRLSRQYNHPKNFLQEISFYETFKGENVLGKMDEEETIILSTIHQAKGLEWEVVFIIGCTQGQFPHFESLEHISKLEEERRLFYVAITRAKSYLYISYPKLKYNSKSGALITKRSLFIEEISPSLYEEYDIEDKNSKIDIF